MVKALSWYVKNMDKNLDANTNRENVRTVFQRTSIIILTYTIAIWQEHQEGLGRTESS